ncbi:MAG: NAD(P)-dependent oxidoreductase [Pseudomonadota bacterium]
MTKSVLITGTSGFLGGSLGKHLREKGYNVTGISRNPSRKGAVDKHITHDLSYPLPKEFPKHEVIFHAAALTSPWANPKAFDRNIVQASKNIANYAQNIDGVRFINVSSTSVHYILDDQENISEETALPKVPANYYSGAKLNAEEYILNILPSALSVRPRAIYGPGDTVLFPRLLRAARKGMLPKIIRSDGKSPKSDLIYIGNLVSILEKAIDCDAKGVVNVTDNNTIDTNELLNKVFQAFGYQDTKLNMSETTAMRIAKIAEWFSSKFTGWKEPPITQFGVSALVHTKTFDVTRMLEIFGQPEYSTENGIKSFVEWHKSQMQE